MTREEAINILDRRTTIPGEGFTWEQINEAIEALLDDPCHWCDPAEARGCAGCARRAPDWRKGAAR